MIKSINKDRKTGIILNKRTGLEVHFNEPHLVELGLTVGDMVGYVYFPSPVKKKVAGSLCVVTYLTKRNLKRAIARESEHLSEEFLKLMGYVVTVKDGWVVKIDGDGNVLEKISKVKALKGKKKIILD
ncbi:MAG: hypothetical protein HY064_11820 [Bacteroidetes bacterium]|nr:hypothetical protein [Bacteroidota bacterium]